MKASTGSEILPQKVAVPFLLLLQFHFFDLELESKINVGVPVYRCGWLEACEGPSEAVYNRFRYSSTLPERKP